MKHVPRVYFNGNILPYARLPVEADLFHHLHRVLKVPSGACVKVFNGVQGEWEGCFELGKKAGTILVQKQLRQQPLPAVPQVCLVAAVLKPQAMAELVDMVTQAHVDEIILVETQHRSTSYVPRERLHSIAQHAAEQSGRLTLPVLRAPVKMQDYAELCCKDHLQDPQSAFHFVADEAQHRTDYPDSDAIGSVSAKKVVMWIGPEGGWSLQEITLLKTFATPVSLGGLILRAPLAAFAGAYCLKRTFSENLNCMRPVCHTKENYLDK